MNPDTIITIQSSVFYRVGDKGQQLLTGKAINDLVGMQSHHWGMGCGAFMLGAVLGWNLYFINRYRKRDNMGIGDLAAIVSALAGVVILAYFDNGLELTGWYGIGLAFGFFTYFLFLIRLSKLTKDSNYQFPDFFLKVQPDQQPSFRFNETTQE